MPAMDARYLCDGTLAVDVTSLEEEIRGVRLRVSIYSVISSARRGPHVMLASHLARLARISISIAA